MRIPLHFALILFIAISSLALQIEICFATPPHPPTIVEQVNGKWRLQDGYVGGPAIVLLDASGKATLHLTIADALSKEDYKTYVRISTAGPIWSDYAVSYFVTLKRSRHFCVRTWWGRRILLNLGEAKQVSDAPFKQQLKEMEKRLVLQQLRAGVAHVTSWDKASHELRQETNAAALLAGSTKLTAAIPLLQKLERVERIDSSISAGGVVDAYSLNETRRIMQLSLRRLGRQPKGMAPIRLDFANKHRGVALALRHQRMHLVKRGMKPIDVLHSIGAPDYIEFDFHDEKLNLQSDAWRYDIDATKPYTLWISWREDDTVGGIDTFAPALWKGSSLFKGKLGEPFFEADGSIIAPEELYKCAFKGTAKQIK